MNLRTMTMADIPSGMRLKNLAGWNQTPTDWERFLRASPDGCFVMEEDGQVIGTATTIAYDGRFAWIGMVLVDPDFRGRGIGTRLLEKAIEYLDARGIPTIKLDATPQGRPIYEKLGFVAEYEIERCVLRRPCLGQMALRQGTRPKAEMTLGDRISDRLLESVFKLDAEVFGGDRSGLLRSLHADAPAFTLTTPTSVGDVTGYALGRCGSHADHLGPWVARDKRTVRQLLLEFLGRSQREALFVDLVKPNAHADALLRSQGFGFSRPLTRMYRGPNAHPGRPEFVCGILGPEFG
jgi:GNAT superfamily N-acetyltransferase